RLPDTLRHHRISGRRPATLNHCHSAIELAARSAACRRGRPMRTISMSKTMFALAVLAGFSCGVLPPAVDAHGRPEHGGVFDEVEDYTFELIASRSLQDDVSFRLYIKDPALKAVTTGDVTLQVNLGADKVVPLKLKPTDGNAFEGT